jgi:preprotein translocase subunit SecG
MTFVLDVVQVFISVMLVFLVLMHSGKDSGLSGFGMGGGTGGGGGPFGGGGGSLVERNLNRWTVLFGVLFAVNTLVLVKVG